MVQRTGKNPGGNHRMKKFLLNFSFYKHLPVLTQCRISYLHEETRIQEIKRNVVRLTKRALCQQARQPTQTRSLSSSQRAWQRVTSRVGQLEAESCDLRLSAPRDFLWNNSMSKKKTTPEELVGKAGWECGIRTGKCL